MVKDIGWKAFLSDDERYADLINGIGCGGLQVVDKTDMHEMDTQTGMFQGLRFIRSLPIRAKGRTLQIRDAVRKTAFGMNFAIIGVENQELIDYEIPLRNLSYDVGEYEKQARKIRKEVRAHSVGLSLGEFLYGFRKDSRLYPVVTFILYTGEAWDGPMCLHDILDFSDIPEKLCGMAADYKIHLVEIRKFEDTQVFRTDVRYLFDFIRNAGDKAALKALVNNNSYYEEMDDDAYYLAASYANVENLLKVKDYHRKDGKINMRSAIQEMIDDGRAEGITQGKAEGASQAKTAIILNMIRSGMTDSDIQTIAECDQAFIDEIRRSSAKKTHKSRWPFR